MLKKAQFWYADFLLAILILVAISFLFVTTITNLNSQQDKLQSLASDAFAISSSFMSEGYCPSNCLSDWRDLNGRIGFVKEGKVLQNNLQDLINLVSTNSDYENSKILLGTRNNYIFYFEDNTNTKIPIIGGDVVYGNPSVNYVSEINAESLVRTTRIAYLPQTQQIVRLIIIVW